MVGRPKKSGRPPMPGGRHKVGILLDDRTLAILRAIRVDKSAWIRSAIIEKKEREENSSP